MHYLAFDLETGGKYASKDAILEGYFAIYDENRVFLDDLYIRFKPDLTKYSVSQEALDVNKIDMNELMSDPTALTYEQAQKAILDFLSKHKIKGKRRHFTPLGQNVKFDIDFIVAQLIPLEDWEKLVHYIALDTLQAVSILKDCDILPTDIGNLSSLVEYFEIPLGEAHTARDDVKMTVEVYWKIKDLLMGAKKSIALNATNDELLSVVEE